MYEDLNRKTRKLIENYLHSLPCWGIVTLFYNNPGTYGRIEDIAVWTGLKKKYVRSAIQDLTKKGILIYEEKSKSFSFKPSLKVKKQLGEFFNRYDPAWQRFYILENELKISRSKKSLISH